MKLVGEVLLSISFFVVLVLPFNMYSYIGHPKDHIAWCNRHGAQEGNPVSLTPRQLLHPDRFDVMAKYVYAYLREIGAHSKWGFELYHAHLNVWGGCTEGHPRKYGINDFLDSFHKTLDAIKEHGFDSAISRIPVRIDNHMALNGGHRIAAALLYHPDRPIECSTICAMRGLMDAANYHYFKDKTDIVKTGLAEKYLDAMALEYVKVKPNSFAICLYHRARTKDDEVENIIKHYAHILYIKDIELSGNGPRNFIEMAYDGESFTKVKEYLQLQIDGCFDNGLSEWPVRIFFVETNVPEKIIECKQKIRSMFNVGKRSVHINDTHQETLRIAKSVLNQNSIHFLNHAHPNTHKRFSYFFRRYRDWLDTSTVDKDRFCIDSSAVMAAYGIRDCKDLDYLHFGYENCLPELNGIDSHNSWAHHYPIHKDEIIFNPDYHFYYKGYKFASLDVVKKMKILRNEPKDQKDVQLIEEY